ncbi:MAG: methyltransferase domain-containing protein [Terracidiphilus sp.]
MRIGIVASAIWEPDQLRARMDALDELDALIPDTRVESLFARAAALRERLEAANGAVYAAIRDEVRRGAGAECLRKWIAQCAGAGAPQPGLGYDHLDELIPGVLGLNEPVSEAVLTPEMVFYQPTPARHILEMIRASGLGEDDVLIDLGSGLGHVAMLASILTGARAIGIEVDPAFVRCARECAAGLGLERVTFAEADARDADLSAGTVFHLYTPFTGGMLRSVLDRLRREADKRAIRVCTLGPCVEVVAKQSWLRAATVMDTDRMSCFVSREPSLRG